MSNILINPNSGLMEFTTGTAGVSSFDAGITGGNRAARLSYDNFGGLNLTSYVSNVTGVDRFTIDGANGRLFSVTDNLSGSLFSVNDIAGLPIIEAFDDNTVIMGGFNRNDFVLTGNALGLGGLPNTGTTKLYVSGNVQISGGLFVSGNAVLTGSSTLYATSANLASTGSALATNLASTGSTLDTKINTLSGYVTGANATFASITNLASTGSTLDTKINNLSGVSVLTFGNQNISGNKTFVNNIQVSGTGIFNAVDFNNIDIISLSGVDISITNGNVALTNRPTVNGTGVLLSGEASAITLPTTIVYTTGNQIISGNKTFISGVTFSGQNINIIDASLNLSGVGDMTFEGTNINFINSPVFISGTNLRVVGDVIGNNLVYNTGNQNISGNKNFYGNILLSGNYTRIGPNHNIEVDGDFVYIKQANDNVILSTEEFSLFDSNEINSVSWADRKLNNRNGAAVLYWTGDNIGIGTNTPSEKLQVIGNILGNNLVYNTGNQTISGIKTFIGNHIISGNTTISGSINISGNYDIYSQLENAKKLAIAYAIAL